MTSPYQTSTVSSDGYVANKTNKIYEQMLKGYLTDCVIVVQGKFIGNFHFSNISIRYRPIHSNHPNVQFLAEI